MANTIIKRTWNRNRMVNIEDLQGFAFQSEDDAHTFEISGIDDAGNAVPLTGTVAGVFRRADNADIALTGTAADGVASVTLTEDCYAIIGRFALTIFVTADSQTTAIYAAIGTVAQTSGNGVAGSTPQDVVDLINAIAAAVATIPASYTNLMATIAPTYSSSALYSVGSYAWYNGSLYRCTTAITTAETWTAAHWTAAVLGQEIQDEDGYNTDIKNMIGSVESTSDAVSMTGSAINAGLRGNFGETLQTISTSNYWYAKYPVVAGGKYNYLTTEITSSNYPHCAWILDQNDVIVRAFDKSEYEGTFIAPQNATSFVLMSPGRSSYAGSLSKSTYRDIMGDLHNVKAVWIESAREVGNLMRNAISILSDVRWQKKTVTEKLGTGELAGYKSILMPVDQNTDYAFTYGRYVYYVDSDKETLLNSGTPLQRVTACNSGSAYYLAISFDNSSYPLSSYVFCKGTSTIGKADYMVAFPWLNIDEQVSVFTSELNSRNILFGKKWAVCGDSFTNSGGTGTVMPSGTKYAGQPYTYPWIIGSRQNMDIVKFFEGGRTLAFPAQPGTFENSLTNPNADWYYQNIPADADYITIYLGINDEHHAPSGSSGDGEDTTGDIPLGTVDDATTSTYLGAWNVVLTWLITNRPNAHIGMIVTNGIAGNDLYRHGQIAIAEKYGIPYIDMNGDARTPAMLRTSNPNIAAAVKTALIQKWAVSPGTNEHPNDAAQLFESTFIEAFLRSL